jgi:hypothetical protein
MDKTQKKKKKKKKRANFRPQASPQVALQGSSRPGRPFYHASVTDTMEAQEKVDLVLYSSSVCRQSSL